MATDTNTTSASPIAQAAQTPVMVDAGTKGEIYQQVNQNTDTVYGQMNDKWLKFDNPLMKRVAQQGMSAGAARGLTNSTVATGMAIGQVVDQAGKFAQADAQFYNDRKTENQRAETHIQGTKISADAQIQSANIGAAAQISAANISAKNQLAIAQLQSETALKTTEMDNQSRWNIQQSVNNSNLTIAELDNQNRLAVQNLSDQAAMDRLNVDTTSRESIAQMEVTAQAQQAELDRQSRERQTLINAQNNMDVATMQQDRQDGRAQTELENSIWHDYNTGVMNIDLNASPASQREQLNRLNDTLILRQESAGLIETALNNYTPSFPTSGGNNFGGGGNLFGY